MKGLLVAFEGLDQSGKQTQAEQLRDRLEAQGLDPEWLVTIQRYLPQPDVTILLDIPPEVSARRKQSGRDKYEQDLPLLGRVRDSYLRQAAAGWVRLDADRDRDLVAADVYAAVSHRL